MRTWGRASRRTRAAALGLLAVWAIAVAAHARIYRWVDERGVPHFSDRAEDVPPAFRHQLDLPAPEEDEAPEEAARVLGGTLDEGDGATVPPWKRVDDRSARQLLENVPRTVLVAGIAAFLGILGIAVAFGAVVLLVACRMVGQESPGFRKAYGIVLVQLLAGMVVAPGVVVVTGASRTLGVQTANAALTLLVNAAVLRGMLCESFGRALAIAVMVVVVSVALGIALALGFLTCGLGSAVLHG